jgi:hypothetical protein
MSVWVPVPVREALSGLLPALVVNVKLSRREPIADGVKAMETMQFDPAPRDAPQVLLRMEKSAEFVPVRVIEEMTRLAFPVFVNVTLWDALVVVMT